ncbi:MAG: ABC transporter ATP-binding protein [Verrucomicrobiota bacterium]
MPLLELKNIHVHYSGVKALDGIDLHIDAQEIVALMGANGAGKSTILKTIFGLVQPDKGKILLQEKEIHPVPEKMVHQGIAYIPQGRQIFTDLTIVENLEMGGYSITDSKLLRERMAQILDLFPFLKTKQKAVAGNLSGGQQQQLALAIGLITHPKILLLDEPTLGLSPKMVEEILSYIQQIHHAFNTTILVVEHNIQSLSAIVDRIYVLEQGTILTHGKPSDLHKQKIWNKVFLGEALSL